MKIAFTICSNNYLAQAKALADSLTKHNPEYKFIIGLADTKSPIIDYSFFHPYEILPADEIGIPAFDDLWKKYSIIEFNTCVKPFYFEFLNTQYPGLEYLVYFDPDTFVFDDLTNMENEWGADSTILLTPHILSPIAIDEKWPSESLFLNYGIYNLGFLGLKSPELSTELIDWWKERTYKLGYYRPQEGLFVDQLWHNLVPLFFKKVKVSEHPGLNMGPWNLHERKLSNHQGKWMVNIHSTLIFYHFSGYKYLSPNSIHGDYNRFNFQNRPDLVPLYKDYHEKLIENNIAGLCEIRCAYMDKRAAYLKDAAQQEQTFRRSFFKVLKPFLPPVLMDWYIKLRR